LIFRRLNFSLRDCTFITFLDKHLNSLARAV
jgi:hypothetical protein